MKKFRFYVTVNMLVFTDCDRQSEADIIQT
jgi:hypothetical protein